LINCTSGEADAIVTGCAEQIESVAEMLADLDGRFTQIIDSVQCESFTPEQRANLKHWHIGCQHAKIALRKTYG